MRVVWLAWLGGAAFAGSLTYLVYFYAVVLAIPAPAGSAVRAVAVNLLLFTTFALHHSLFARATPKAWVTRLAGPGERTVYVWVASVLLFGVCLLWQPVPGIVYAFHGWWALPFWTVQAAGAWVTVRGAAVIDPRELAGVPRSPRHESFAGTIRIEGPFRRVRHPIYIGWMLMVGAAPTMTAGRLLFAVMSSGYLLLAIPWEERALLRRHGDEYRRYQQMVRWRVVPGLW